MEDAFSLALGEQDRDVLSWASSQTLKGPASYSGDVPLEWVINLILDCSNLVSSKSNHDDPKGRCDDAEEASV